MRNDTTELPVTFKVLTSIKTNSCNRKAKTIFLLRIKQRFIKSSSS